ncbi:MAG: hypothetical protein KAX70_05475, partial [Pseudomonas sp.]|nr:hypothetical protein [Pseudomonas sp.]
LIWTFIHELHLATDLENFDKRWRYELIAALSNAQALYQKPCSSMKKRGHGRVFLITTVL